ncbi:MAG: hypothetical protein RIB78_01055 [Gammaproteobacteria bacterium]
MAKADDFDDDDVDSVEDDVSYEETSEPTEKLISLKRRWRDIEIERELRMLERELGEKLDRNIFE